MTIQNSDHSQALSTAPIKGKYTYTEAEARQYGIPIKSPAPASVNCKYCGKELNYEGVLIFGEIFHWFDMPEKCTCTKAKEYWQRKADEKAFIEAQKAELLKKELFQKRLDRANLSKRQQKQMFDSFQVTKENSAAKDAAINYCRNFERMKAEGVGLYIGGSCGSGKTHLACAVAIDLLEKEHDVLVESSVELVDKLKKNFGRDEEVLIPYLSCDVLVIDDLGKEQCTEWTASMLYKIINNRYNSLKPIIITTNYDEAHLIARLTPKDNDSTAASAIVSRLHETCIAVTLCGKDHRRE